MSPNPDIFQIISNNAGAIALLGSNPTRFYPFARAPKLSPKPYAVYQVYNGVPQNYLGRVPDIDDHGTQIDVYGSTADECEQAWRAVRDALEPHFYMASFATPERDAETDDYHARLEFDVWQTR